MTLEQEILAELRALRNEVAELRNIFKPKADPVPRPAPAECHLFEEFWSHYPRKVSKRAAQFAWKGLKQAEKEQILAVMPQWAESWRHTEMQYIPHASTWLNQRRFNDELQQAIPVQAKLPRTDDEWLALAREKGVNTIPGESWASLKDRIASA